MNHSIQTEADALREILSWSKHRPKWQCDALRRLVTRSELTPIDIDELIELCKNYSLPGEPITEEHINAKKSGTPAISLKNLRGVQNVNALAKGQSLKFNPKGVTVIYGDNGTGKSGYVRILKKVCRARIAGGKAEQILPNTYANRSGVQCAELEYQVGAETRKTEWKNDGATDDLLSEISVFDSSTANVYVEKTNNVAYTPFPMKLLERLADACKSVKDRIEAEISTIEQRRPYSISNPPCSSDTEVGRLLKFLTKDTDSKSVAALAKLSENEQARLAELTTNFAEDPKAAVHKLRRNKMNLEKLRYNLEKLAIAISLKSARQAQELEVAYEAKRTAAKLASRNLLKDELLDVGSDTWRTLWEAAREYSITEPYRDQKFPVTESEARCVLCQQKLDQDAVARLKRFEGFVQDQAQQEAETARQALLEFQGRLCSSKLIARRLLDNNLPFLRDDNPNLANSISRFMTKARWRLRALLQKSSNTVEDIPQFSNTPLEEAINELEDRAKALEASDESVERKRLRASLNELKGRQWLSDVKDDVLAEIERLKLIAMLKDAQKDTQSYPITSKSTELSEKLITETLRMRFKKEIECLSVTGVDIELTREYSRHGASRFKVSLAQSKSKNAGEILSEGEYRCVALASFMTELATNNSDSGIIFDDPVSSFDHHHREAIAQRLAEEGRKRQVIVFTHDLPFQLLLQNACEDADDPQQRTKIAWCHIQKQGNEPGYCIDEIPDKAKKPLARLKKIRDRLARVQGMYKYDPNSEDWLFNAPGIVTNLRQAWEASVEHAISPVLKRFSSKIYMNGLSKISEITSEDAEEVQKHYGWCSTYLHKASDEINETELTPDSIERELNALEKWLRSISDRQK